MSEITRQQNNDVRGTEQNAVQAAVQQATEQAYCDWARAHPSLASVIDRIVLTERTAESLRQSADFRRAVTGFYESQNELDLTNQLMDLAGPILRTILGM